MRADNHPSHLLIELVNHYSPSGQEQAAVSHLTGWMCAHDFDAWIDDAGNACGRRGPANAPATLILLGHIDTVPGMIPIRDQDGWLWGRGTVDAKGPLCAFAEATAQAAIPDGWQVLVIGAVGEEADSPGAQFVRTQYNPDLCVIGEPSGASRITLGYKGHLRLHYRLSRPRVHSSRDEPGVAALGCDFWGAIRAWAAAENEGYARTFDQISPHLLAINTQLDDFSDTLEMTVSLRLPQRTDPASVLDAVAPLAAADGHLQAERAAPAYEESKQNALVRGLLTAIRAQGERPAFVLKGGTSDMNTVCSHWRCPIVAYGPGDSQLDHTPDERIAWTEYGQAVRVLRHLLEHLPPPASA